MDWYLWIGSALLQKKTLVSGGGGGGERDTFRSNLYQARQFCAWVARLVIPFTGKKIVFRTLGFILSTLGSVPSNISLLS